MALDVFPSKRLEANPWVFPTLADMRLGPTPTNRDLGFLLGSVAAFDNVLWGLFAFDATSVLADNGTTVIKPTVMTTGRWRKLL